MSTTTKFDEIDEAIEQLTITLTLTHKEAGVVYALIKTFEGHTAFDAAILAAIITKINEAQCVAIAQQVQAEFASGRPT